MGTVGDPDANRTVYAYDDKVTANRSGLYNIGHLTSVNNGTGTIFTDYWVLGTPRRMAWAYVNAPFSNFPTTEATRPANGGYTTGAVKYDPPYQTPAAYAAALPATCDRLNTPDQFRRSPVAHPAPQGVKPVRVPNAAG